MPRCVMKDLDGNVVPLCNKTLHFVQMLIERQQNQILKSQLYNAETDSYMSWDMLKDPYRQGLARGEQCALNELNSEISLQRSDMEWVWFEGDRGYHEQAEDDE